MNERLIVRLQHMNTRVVKRPRPRDTAAPRSTTNAVKQAGFDKDASLLCPDGVERPDFNRPPCSNGCRVCFLGCLFLFVHAQLHPNDRLALRILWTIPQESRGKEFRTTAPRGPRLVVLGQPSFRKQNGPSRGRSQQKARGKTCWVVHLHSFQECFGVKNSSKETTSLW